MSKDETTQKKGVSDGDDNASETDQQQQQSQEVDIGSLPPHKRRNMKMSQLGEKRADEFKAGQENAADHRLVDSAAAYGDTGAPIEDDDKNTSEGADKGAPASEQPGADDGAEGKTSDPDGKAASGSDDTGTPATSDFDPEQLPESMQLKVNGEIVTLKRDEIVKALQKDLYADQRLQDAARIHKELDQRAAQLQRQEEEAKTQQTAPGDQPDQGELRERLQTAVQHLLDAEEEQAVELLTNIISAGRPADATSTPPNDDVVQQAADRVMQTLAETEAEEAAAEFESDMKAGYADFLTEYPTIAKDDILLAATDAEIKRIQAKHAGDPEWTPSKIIMAAGKEIHDRFVDPPEAPPASEDESRQSAKDNLKPIPTGRSSAKKAEDTEPEVDLSPSGAIKRMRAGRVASQH